MSEKSKRTATAKALAAIAAIAVALALASCVKPPEMDQRTYDLGQQAVSIGEDYLDGTLHAEAARDMLGGVYDEIDAYEPDNEVKHLLVGSDVMALESDLSPFSPASDDEFAEDLKELKRHLR